MTPTHSVFRLSVVTLPTERLVARPGVRIAGTISGTVTLDWQAPKARARDHALELTPHEARKLAGELLRAAGDRA